MLDQREIHALMQSTGEFLAYTALDPRPASETLTEEQARKIGETHGFGDKAACRLIYALACYILEHKGEELVRRQNEMVALVAGKRPDEVIQ